MASEHWCDTHKTKFFKTQKMRGYAHPVKDADGKTTAWCNEDAEEVAKLEPQSKDEMLPEHKEVVGEARRAVAFDPTRKSIERQTALKSSTELAVAKIVAGKETSLNEILSVAIAFESYIENGATVEKKK